MSRQDNDKQLVNAHDNKVKARASVKASVEVSGNRAAIFNNEGAKVGRDVNIATGDNSVYEGDINALNTNNTICRLL